MTAPTTPPTAVPSDITRARKILAKLCDNGLVSMSIPVRDEDEDMVLSRVIESAALAASATPGSGEPVALNVIAELMRAVDAYAFDYAGAGKIASSRTTVENALRHVLTGDTFPFAAASAGDALTEALTKFVAIKPQPYGTVGTRDVDIAAWQAAHDEARAALASAPPAPALSEPVAARYRHLVAACNVDFDPSEPWQLVIWEPSTGEDWKGKLDAAIDQDMKGGE